MFFQGLVLGLAVAVPVGPIGLLCLQRSLVHGRRHGFVSGLGAATADACYGLVAALGLTAVSAWLLGLQTWLQLGGGLILLGLALRFLLTAPQPLAEPAATDSNAPGPGLLPAFASVFALTLANPATLLSFLAVFAALGLGAQPSAGFDGLLLVAGVFLGSSAWWLTLTLAAGLLRRRLDARGLRAVNRLAGLSLLLLAAWSLWPLLRAAGK